jgi:hypothetical protein
VVELHCSEMMWSCNGVVKLHCGEMMGSCNGVVKLHCSEMMGSCNGVVKLHCSEMMWSCKSFPHASIILTHIVVMSFIGGGNRRKPLTLRTELTTKHNMVNMSHKSSQYTETN